MKTTKANIESKQNSIMEVKATRKREAMKQINEAIKAWQSGILLF